MSTNPRIAETTTPEYITVIQDLKQQAKKSLRSDYKTNSTKALASESTTISNTKYTICNHQLNTAVGLKIHITKMHKNINKTKINKLYPIDRTIKIFSLTYLFIYIFSLFVLFERINVICLNGTILILNKLN